MSEGFLYFFPDACGVLGVDRSAELCAKAGLTDTIGGLSLSCRECVSGPGGKNGLIAAPAYQHASTGDARYKPIEQTWQECEGGTYWLGYWNERKPTPDALRRNEMIDGYTATLGDGCAWVMPAAIAHDGTEPLPVAARWGNDGRVVREIIPRYADISGRARKIADSVLHSGGVDFGVSPDEALEIAAEALSVNYHINKYGLGMLGVFSPEQSAVAQVLFSLCDGPFIVEAMTQKKTDTAQATDTGSTRDGREG